MFLGNCAMLNIPGFTFPVRQFLLEDVLELLQSVSVFFASSVIWWHYYLRQRKVMFLPVSVCPVDYSKSYKGCWWNFFWRDGRGPRTEWLDFDGYWDHDPDTGIF